jgi:hypothetical protein
MKEKSNSHVQNVMSPTQDMFKQCIHMKKVPIKYYNVIVKISAKKDLFLIDFFRYDHLK